MADTSDAEWRYIGKADELAVKKCQRLHSAGGKQMDLALFHHQGRFYAMEAWCSHLGQSNVLQLHFFLMKKSPICSLEANAQDKYFSLLDI